MVSSADILAYHQPTLYLQRSGDYQWQLPAPSHDRHWRRRDRPYMTPQQPTSNHGRAFKEGSRHNSMSGSGSSTIRPRSGTATTSRFPNENSLSPSPPTYVSAPGDPHDMRSISESIVSRTDRPESLTKSLVSKGYKLLRRQSSKSDLTSLRTIDWMEPSKGEKTSRKNLKHSRWQSTDSVGIKHDISNPYNFQHLTHTHAKQVQELKRASHNELVTGFFAIRASQAPRQELKGIKAQSLENKAILAESLPQDLTDPVTPPSKSPTRSQYQQSNNSFSTSSSLTYSRSIENFSQPSPGAYKMPTSPSGPPPRVSSRQCKHDQSAYNSEVSGTEDVTAISCQGVSPTFGRDSLGDEPYALSNAPHAVTTPDETAATLRSFPFGSAGTELADVPEEDEHCAKRSSSGSGLRHSRSCPNHRLRSYRFSQTLPPPTACDYGSLPLDGYTSIDRVPCIDQPFDDIPVTPRVSRRISVGPKGIDASWEEDIDYCYEHAAEADCDFDWERVSRDDEKSNEANKRQAPSLDVDSALDDLIDEYENICLPTSDREDSQMHLSPADITPPHKLPPLQTLIPDSVYSSANSSKFPNSSIRGTLTPAQLFPSAQSIRLPAKSAKNFDFSPSLLIRKDDESQMLQEDVYESILDAEHIPAHQYPVHEFRYDASSSRDGSPRSSGSPISKCNSQESMMYSSVLAMRRARETDSVGSLPDLVHSKASKEIFIDRPSSQAVPVASVHTGVDTQPGARQHRRSQSLAANRARQSMLQKATSCSGLIEGGENALPSVSLSSTKRRDRAHSDAAVRILNVCSQPSESTISRKAFR